ncbi:MAG: hypothetical protein ACRD5M_10230 [Candidatus Acidiferrales bacterium]
MRRELRWLNSSLVIAALLVTANPCGGQQQPDSSNAAPVTTVVTVLGPKFTPPPAISKDDILVHEGQARKDVLDWFPAQGDKAGLELAILVDDADRKDVGKQFDDLSSFIRSLPKSTSVGVYYASNNTITIASQITPDHDAAAKGLRLPIGSGVGSSIYQSLMALISGWPVSGARREVLLLADGFDRLRHEVYSPDVQTTVGRAQQAGVIVHAIFVNGTGFYGRARGAVNVAQGNLNTITDGTGGKAFFQGFQTPISFVPFLTQLDLVLRNQYFLTWTTNRSKNAKGELRGFKVSIEQHNVEITAAQKIFVPGEK